jgi:hypothetical protein
MIIIAWKNFPAEKADKLLACIEEDPIALLEILI